MAKGKKVRVIVNCELFQSPASPGRNFKVPPIAGLKRKLADEIADRIMAEPLLVMLYADGQGNRVIGEIKTIKA